MPYSANWSLEMRDGYTALARLNSPDTQNMLNREVLHELLHLSRKLAREEDVRAVVLGAVGKHFSIGMDLRIIEAMKDGSIDRPTYENELRGLQGCLDEFEAIEKPIIAAIDGGFCIGGGMVMTACCDLRFAGEKALFSLPEVKASIGVIMGSKRITRLIGLTRTKEMMLTGEWFTAAQMYEWGFLNRVIHRKSGTALDAALKYAKRFHALPADGLAINKRILSAEEDLTIREGEDYEIQAQGDLLFPQQ